MTQIWIVDFESKSKSSSKYFKGYIVISADNLAHAISSTDEYLEHLGYTPYKLSGTTYTPCNDREVLKCKLWMI